MEQIVSRDGAEIAFLRDGSGPPLILVDPAAGFRGFGPMKPLADRLISSFTVLTYDRRGRGDSTDGPSYAPEREVEDLEALMGVVGGSAFVYGFSSGAVLALGAASHGLGIDKLAVMEPPLDVSRDPSEEPDPLAAEIADLLSDGRRGEAFMHFNRAIGVPEEMLAGMKDAPVWPALEDLAHTLVYDLTITSSFPAEALSGIATPTMVVTSEVSDDRLQQWARDVATALPEGHLRRLPGAWHGISPEVLAPALEHFFLT